MTLFLFDSISSSFSYPLCGRASSTLVTPVFWDCISIVVILFVIFLSSAPSFSLCPHPFLLFSLIIFLAILRQLCIPIQFLSCPFHLKINKWQYIHFCFFLASHQWESLVAIIRESKSFQPHTIIIIPCPRQLLLWYSSMRFRLFPESMKYWFLLPAHFKVQGNCLPPREHKDTFKQYEVHFQSGT